jgi:ABC-type proline/glycine betaine transport system ATPase subunit
MPWRTVDGNVGMPLRLRGCPPAEAKQRVLESLHLVGLEDFATSYPRQLSGGMKMRASIARALVVQPQVLLLDEPFAALDELTREQLNEDLLHLQQAQRWTVIFVTHSVHEAVFLSSRILIMSPRPGRIVHDIAMDCAAVRDDAYRTSVAYAEQCRQVSVLLHAAMGGKRRVDTSAPVPQENNTMNTTTGVEPEVQEITVSDLEARLQHDPQLVVVDVRENEEVAAGIIAGAIHMRLGDLPARYTELPDARAIHFICRGGGRSARACLFLYQRGRTDAVSVAGGMEAWQNARRPVTVLGNDRGDPLGA